MADRKMDLYYDRMDDEKIRIVLKAARKIHQVWSSQEADARAFLDTLLEKMRFKENSIFAAGMARLDPSGKDRLTFWGVPHFAYEGDPRHLEEVVGYCRSHGISVVEGIPDRVKGDIAMYTITGNR